MDFNSFLLILNQGKLIILQRPLPCNPGHPGCLPIFQALFSSQTQCDYGGRIYLFRSVVCGKSELHQTGWFAVVPSIFRPVILYRITRAMNLCSRARQRFVVIIWLICRQIDCVHRRREARVLGAHRAYTDGESGVHPRQAAPRPALESLWSAFQTRRLLTFRHDQFIGQLFRKPRKSRKERRTT